MGKTGVAYTSSSVDLAGEFVRAATAAATTVVCVPRQAGPVAAALLDVTRNTRSIVLSAPEHLEPTLLAAFHPSAIIAEPTDEQLSTADVGITDAFAGVASTGSVCISIGKSLSAAASLLMPLHVVLLPVERIVAQPRDLFDPRFLNGEGLTRSFVFATGPSATADMGELVRGVHGPHRLHVIVVEL